jgi:hypothetical protein
MACPGHTILTQQNPNTPPEVIHHGIAHAVVVEIPFGGFGDFILEPGVI